MKLDYLDRFETRHTTRKFDEIKGTLVWTSIVSEECKTQICKTSVH
jgi:hypothetical protein